MAHAVQGHPIHWHVDPNIGQEIEHYNARRRKNQAGHGARESLGGEGYKVQHSVRAVQLLRNFPAVQFSIFIVQSIMLRTDYCVGIDCVILGLSRLLLIAFYPPETGGKSQ